MALGTVLLVEDDERDVTLFRHTFKSAGIENPLSVAGTVQEAIEHLQVCSEESTEPGPTLPIAVFIDLQLPGCSGHELLAWMRERPAVRRVLRIVLTGSDDPEDLWRATQLGANSYLLKPLTIEQLTNPAVNLLRLLAPALAHAGSR